MKQEESWVTPTLLDWVSAWVVVLFFRTGIVGGEETLGRDDKFSLG